MENVLGKQSRFFYMGVAMVAIILHHLVLYPERYCGYRMPLAFLFENGDIGVEVFLFISAYGLGHSWLSNSLFVFYQRRIKRIYPMYLLFLLLASFFIHQTDILHHYWLKQILCVPVFEHGVNNIEWFIPSLLFLYLLYPLFYSLVNWSTKIKWGKYIFYTIIVYSTYISSIYLNPLMTYRIPVFIMGIYTFVLLRHNDKDGLYRMFILSALLGFVTYKNDMMGTLCIPMILLMLSFISLDSIPTYIYNGISFVGKHSLEIYLAQMLGTKFFMQIELPIPLSVIGAIVITTIVACVLYYFQKYFYVLSHEIGYRCKF